MIPVLDKNAVKVLTQAMNGEQAEYVAGVSDIMQDVNRYYPEYSENKDDILFVEKIMSFADKFKNLHWAAVNNSYHKELDNFGNELESFKDDIAENIQAILGQFNANQFTKLILPVGDDPLEIINELKDCVNDWFELHKEEIQYEGCRNILSGFLEIIYKYIYIFRLCKQN